MMKQSKYELLEHILSAVIECGWSVQYPLTSDIHPFRFSIYKNTEVIKLRVYIWNLTHGGGHARPQNEYRIQITGTNQFEISPGIKTLVLGWWSEIGVFAGFDVRKHNGILGFSPSIQIREESLRQAYINGFAPCSKENREIAIAFRPDFFVDYARDLEILHGFGESQADLSALVSVAENPEVNAEEIPIENAQRKIIVTTVSRKLRDVSFRRRVLTAYGNKCAICGIQLNLVEAAHIIPVTHESSNDETRNGLALCSLHHKAFDQTLLTVIEDYSVILNQRLLRELDENSLIDGFHLFHNNIRPIIILPPAIADRPHVDYLRIANIFRGWE